MAYTRPSASAADVSWSGSGSYTRPAASAADVSFLTANSASSIAPGTNFGAPVAAYARTQTATGAAPSTTFGTAKFGTTVAATSIAPNTKLGAPPRFGPVVTTLYGNGADGSTTFLDDSPYYWPVTRNGSIAVSTAQSRFGTGSISLTGDSTANNLVVGPSKLFNLTGWGSSFPQFTIEAEVFLNAYNSNGGRLLSAGGGASGWGTYGSSVNGHHWMLQSTATGVQFTWMWYGDYSGFTNFHMFSLSAPLSLSTWAQIKVTSDGATVRLFVDGALIGSDSGHPLVGGMANLTFNYPAYIAVGALYGEASGSTCAANAYVQHIRIRRECTDTAAFSAPTAGLGRWIGELAGIAPTTQVPTPRGLLGLPVTGFQPTQFGLAFGQNLQRPTGFRTGTVGDPRIFPYSPPPINSTQFGHGRLFPYHVAPGIHSTGFGAAVGWQYWDVEWSTPGTRLGTPSTPTDRTAEASGFAVGFVGSPSKIGRNPPTGSRICIAAGRLTTKTGLPRATWPLLSGATGFSTSSTGTPTGRISQRAAWIWTTGVGDVSACLSQRATGFVSLGIGFSAAVMTQRTTGSMFRQRFGLPESDRSNTYKAYGVNASGRIGRPTGACRFNYSSAGFSAGYVGNPACFERHRVRSAPPGAGFGRPLLRRNTQC